MSEVTTTVILTLQINLKETLAILQKKHILLQLQLQQIHLIKVETSVSVTQKRLLRHGQKTSEMMQTMLLGTLQNSTLVVVLLHTLLVKKQQPKRLLTLQQFLRSVQSTTYCKQKELQHKLQITMLHNGLMRFHM